MILRLAFLLAALFVEAPSSASKEIGPDAPWCEAMHSLAAGSAASRSPRLMPAFGRSPCVGTRSERQDGPPSTWAVMTASSASTPNFLSNRTTSTDNMIVDTKGPGIMIYGAQEFGSVSVVERNFVANGPKAIGNIRAFIPHP